ncbi:hypothetical protein PF004_g7914 [Phytophthora fragariae]|uniref:Uncharacterized protein n=1 Tax=Phytophthora fragariae TaxID=53985 RepID=A0A6G0P8H5_9STRA|nr:hypothetical protein PF004_g7914 [Phytophthora fragariae]
MVCYEASLQDLLSVGKPTETSIDKERAGGGIKLFEAAANDDFKSVSQLFARLKALKDEANRNSGDALQTEVISSNLMMLKILGVLPNHMWGQVINPTPGEFTQDWVEAKLCAIFGSKSRAEIMALDRGCRLTTYKPLQAPLSRRS